MKRTVGWAVGLGSGLASAALLAQDLEAGRQDRSVRTDPIAGTVGGSAPPRTSPAPTVQDGKADGAASAQRTPATTAEDPAPAGGPDIVVSGSRPRGSVVGDIPPERIYTPLDIRVFGADDIATLVQSIEPQAGSNRAGGERRPLVLLNGRRVSSFAEIARIPSEAIERMEVFPEDVALKYGARPDQKVVNMVTFETFTSRIVQSNVAAATEGGFGRGGTAGTVFTIRNGMQTSVAVDYARTATLLESERAIRQPSGSFDDGRFRSLLPTDETVSLNSTVSTPLAGDTTASINGRFERNRSRSLLGPGPSGPLTREVGTDVGHLGATINGRAGKWQWSAIGNYDRSRIGISSNAADAARSIDEAVSSNVLGTVDLLANGPILDLPAGTATINVRAGLGTRDFDGRSSDGGPIALARDTRAFQASLDLPISSTRKRPSALGRLTANANLAVERVSDFGTLTTFGYGLSWAPVAVINLYASVTNAQGAPTVEQLGAPRLETPNLRIFDFVRGEAVDITRISGGNPGLSPEDRRTVNLGIYAKPLRATDVTVSIDYVRVRIDDPIVAFPIATADIEAAFPDRIARDGDGRLVQIDARSLNFARLDQSRVRSGINLSIPLGKGPPLPKGTSVSGARYYPNEAAMRAATPPGMVVIEVPAGSDDAARIDALSSRWTVALYHTLNLEDAFRVRRGGPVLDLLNGSAVGLRGGTPRHELELVTGLFKGGLGARVTTGWRSGTTVRGLPGDIRGRGGDLDFSDYSTTNLSLFAIPAQRVGGNAAPGWLKGMRIGFNVTNVFNARPRVVDGTGATPLNYQPAYLEPLGRVFSLSIRKIL